MCAQMVCCTNTARESALKVDCERKTLAALGIEPASVLGLVLPFSQTLYQQLILPSSVI